MNSIRRFLGIIILAVSLVVPVCVYAQDADVEGSKDHPLISRFAGSRINYYKEAAFDEYILPLAGLVDRKISKTQTVEGKTTRIQYEAPEDRSTLEILRNYEDALRKAGFTTLFSGSGKKLAEYSNWPEALYPSSADQYLKLRMGQDVDQQYLSAKLPGPKGNVYVSLYISLGYYKYPLIQLDVIEEKPIETGLVTINAEALSKDIEVSGHAAVYGILFDSNKAEVKPESDAALNEIAKLLSQNPKFNLYIVGHTDDVGTVPSNMDLSQKRADAVVEKLVSKYGADKTRLQAFGVGSLAPVATNKTEEGKARNRRVELVEK